jgi:hypothetical protein
MSHAPRVYRYRIRSLRCLEPGHFRARARPARAPSRLPRRHSWRRVSSLVTACELRAAASAGCKQQRLGAAASRAYHHIIRAYRHRVFVPRHHPFASSSLRRRAATET